MSERAVRSIGYRRTVTRMTATDAGRSFSELLSRVAAGEEVEVTRAGAPVAVIAPSRRHTVSTARFAR